MIPVKATTKTILTAAQAAARDAVITRHYISGKQTMLLVNDALDERLDQCPVYRVSDDSDNLYVMAPCRVPGTSRREQQPVELELVFPKAEPKNPISLNEARHQGYSFGDIDTWLVEFWTPGAPINNSHLAIVKITHEWKLFTSLPLPEGAIDVWLE